MEAKQADGSVMTVSKDQAVRGDTTLEGLASLKPAFKKDGVITAGVSSPLNAAGTGMILMSKEKAQAKGIKPLATIRSIGFAGVDPTIMGAGPVPASKKALEHLGMQPKDIDFWEINEAFAVVALNCIKELGLDPDKVNVMGGGLAIGHPLGATGNRLVGTLARILEAKERPLGLRQRLRGRRPGRGHHHRARGLLIPFLSQPLPRPCVGGAFACPRRPPTRHTKNLPSQGLPYGLPWVMLFIWAWDAGFAPGPANRTAELNPARDRNNLVQSSRI